MKPSEFFNKMYLDNSFLDDVDNDSDNISLIKKQLDKRFIDKEELKNNILQKIFKSKKYPLMTIKEALIISDIEEEILKLLKE